jgi:hypothetical protein
MARDDASELLARYGRQGARFFIVHNLSDAELADPVNGTSRLTAQTIRYLRLKGWDARGVRSSDLPGARGFLKKIHHAAWRLVKKPADQTRGGVSSSRQARFALNLLIMLLEDWIGILEPRPSGFEAMFPAPDGRPRVIIHTHAFGFRAIRRNFREPDKTNFIVFEYNIDWKYYQDKMPGTVYAPLISWTKGMEMDSIRKADYAFCLSIDDKEGLLREGAEKKKLAIWLPICKEASPDAVEKGVDGPFVVGFVGTDAEHNIISVEDIMAIAKELGGISHSVSLALPAGLFQAGNCRKTSHSRAS